MASAVREMPSPCASAIARAGALRPVPAMPSAGNRAARRAEKSRRESSCLVIGNPPVWWPWCDGVVEYLKTASPRARATARRDSRLLPHATNDRHESLADRCRYLIERRSTGPIHSGAVEGPRPLPLVGWIVREGCLRPLLPCICHSVARHATAN